MPHVTMFHLTSAGVFAQPVTMSLQERKAEVKVRAPSICPKAYRGVLHATAQ